MPNHDPRVILTDSDNNIDFCSDIYKGELRTRLRRELRHSGLRGAFKLSENVKNKLTDFITSTPATRFQEMSCIT